MSQRGWPEARPSWDQLVGAQVVVGWRVEVNETLLEQLHHGDRREGLRDRTDAEHRVLRDRGVRCDVRKPVAMEELEASIAHHAHRETDGGVAVEDPVDRGLQLCF